jgi:hypothetical protein
MTDEIERLTDVLRQATEAQEYMAALSSDEREKYRSPMSWQNDPHLQYIYGMSGLF